MPDLSNVERAARAVRAGYVLRQPEPEDADEIGLVHVTVWRQAYRGIISEVFLQRLTVDGAVELWREILTQPESRPAHRLVAIAPDESIAGMIAWGPSRDVNPVAADELFAIDVLRKHHGTGLADMMLRDSIGEASSQMLWVLVGNARARYFYRRHGFLEEQSRRYHEAFEAVEMLMTRRTKAVDARKTAL